ncbi:MAG: glycosyltransferase family 4 protein [Cyclobacteriaceae bacterium]|nr:glycosyltransferase family 4 protein [Cyclobacteriaceae bacterium]MDH4297560.1 glycosyltransferase family 4 protein [Cyclobacteriaceae bacterium]MDH5249964.1 glycosyltransferase family 4 protein [Cyclobacteriaceae bacterium]
MRIAIVVNTSWNIHNFRMNFVHALLAKGHEVHTLAPEDDYTHLLTQAGCVHHRVKMDSRGANPIKDSALIIELFMIYKRVKPDVILHYTIKPNVYGTIAASLLKIPVVNNVCGLGTVFLRRNFVSFIAISLYKISFRFASKIYFQNPEDLRLFLDRRLVPADAADILPGSGIDLKRFQPSTFKRNDKFTFLLISRLITDKGVLEFIEAVRKLRAKGMNAKFQVLGPMDPQHTRGIKIKVIQEWIDSGTIEYLGVTDDVREYIEKADCIVLPSYREGTPRTLLEAASSGKPIIATDVAGCNNVVQNNFNGLLCKLKDAGDLAEKMTVMASLEDEKLKAFGRNGRTKMETEYDEAVVINKYLSTLASLKKAS